MLLTILRVSIFVFSLYGGSRFFFEQIQISRLFSWITHILTIIIVLYIMAYFDLLELTVYLLFGLSTGYGIYSLIRRLYLKEFEKTNLTTVNLWMFFYCILIGLTLWGTYLEHYDNFSHWALIVKFLFTENSLPDATHEIISYNSYPMGTSLYLYYAVKIAGFSDNVMLLGHFSFIASAIYAMFAVIRDRSRVMIIFLMGLGITLFNIYNISIRMNNLLVDFVLPVLALAGISMVFSTRHQPLKMSILVFLTTAVLCLVKSSGMIFAVIVWCYYLYQIIKIHVVQRKDWKILGISLLTVVLSLTPILYWNVYVKANFPVTKHEVSLTTYQTIFNEKDNTVIQEILDKIINYFFDMGQLSTQGLILFNVILLISFLVIRFYLKRPNSLLKMLVLGNFIYIVYYLGIVFMFLFSMPVEEAVNLAGIERYTSSMIIFILGLANFSLAREVDYSFYEQNVLARNYRSYKSLASKQLYQISSILLSFGSLLLLISEVNGMRYLNTQFNESIPAQIMQATGHNFELNNDKYLVVTTDVENVENYYTGFAAMYFLYSTEVVAREAFLMDLDEFRDYLQEFDKIVILEEHMTFDLMMDQLIGNHFGVGIYEVSDIIEQSL
ncbi:lantibiotic ABC transporter permease [Aerococcaceae bacterium DSM 111176]|nr:lantibiotic ABC transporter permease [Aerococcaceae bacterium DSM 111176]